MQLNPTLSPHVAVILLASFAVVGDYVLYLYLTERKQ